MTTTPVMKMFTIDCADPRVLATFWSELLGWQIAHVEDDYAMLTASDGAPALGFGQVPGYLPPAWSNENGSKHFHLDVACDDIAAVEAHCVSLGATVPEEQPGESWRVVLDPAGHPFCFTGSANW